MRIKKSERRKLIEKADKLFRDYIRLRDKMSCQRCGQDAYHDRKIEVAHFYGRSNLTTRWAPDNVCLLCFKCHYLWAHREPMEFSQWWLKRLGEDRFKLLQVRKNMIFDEDLKLIVIGLRELIDAESR